MVRAHINEVRYCYNLGLLKDPELRGELSVGFAIGATGNVQHSLIKSSTVADPAVGTCVAEAVKRWKFPKPKGEVAVQVTYPFELSPPDLSHARY